METLTLPILPVCGEEAVAYSDPASSVSDSCGASIDLPNEVLMNIFHFLEKKDLKVVRLVCRSWSALTIRDLYNRAFVSRRQNDMEVLTAISNHPTIRLAIRELVYDHVYFNPSLSRDQYNEKVMHQTNQALKHAGLLNEKVFSNTDRTVNQFLRVAQDVSRRKNKYIRDLFSLADQENRMLHRGFVAYHIAASEVTSSSSLDEMSARLCTALPRMPNVGGVICDTLGWLRHTSDQLDVCSLRPRVLSGPPTARVWHPLYLHPDPGHSNASSEFTAIVRALSLAQSNVKRFDFSKIRHPFVEQAPSHNSTIMLKHTTSAFQSVSQLRLHMECHNPHFWGTMLPEVLRTVPSLTYLDIAVASFGTEEDPIPLRNLLEPSCLVMPRLLTLKLAKVACVRSELVSFLHAQKKLRNLTLEGIELTEGKWADLLDDFRQRLDLGRFEVLYPLREIGGVDLYTPDTCRGYRLEIKIEQYVVNGGENPLANFEELGSEEDSDVSDQLDEPEVSMDL